MTRRSTLYWLLLILPCESFCEESSVKTDPPISLEAASQEEQKTVFIEPTSPIIIATAPQEDQNTVCTEIIEPALCCPPDEKVLIKNTKGLVLVNCREQLLDKDALSCIEGFHSEVNLPGSSKQLAACLNAIYLCQPLTQEKINQIKCEIQNFYAYHGQPFVFVSIPQQCITEEVLQIIVQETTLGQITVEGNRWTPEKLLKHYVSLCPGDTINVDKLQKDLSFINRNPFRRVNAIYSPGCEPCTTDIVLLTEDRRPFRFYVGADNTGLDRTNRQRLFSGISLNRIWGFDHFFSYQFTTSYDFHRFRGNTGQYIALLPWKHVLNFYGGYSVAHGDLPFPGFSNKARSSQASVRYEIPTVFNQKLQFSVVLGFDYKNTNSTIFFTEAFTNFSSSNVNLSQFILEATLGYELKSCRLELEAQGFWSPGRMLPNENTSLYQSLRPGAENKWIYGKAAFRYTQSLPGQWDYTIWLRGQISNAVLLPSEQFGLGGHSTVRGYDENQLTLDNCAVGNFELRTPPIVMISKIRRFPIKDALQFLAFFDYGFGTNNTATPAEASPIYLMSAGPGIRYTLDPYFAARLDWGWKLHKEAHASQHFTGGDSMVQFSTTLSY